mgnify:CR=1 FL=1
MADISELLKRMEHLPVRDLERIDQYLNSHPYKTEHRKPTAEELADIIRNLAKIISESRTTSEDEDRNARINAALQDMRRFN